MDIFELDGMKVKIKTEYSLRRKKTYSLSKELDYIKIILPKPVSKFRLFNKFPTPKEIVHKHKDWIKEQLNTNIYIPKKETKPIDAGCILYFLGSPHILKYKLCDQSKTVSIEKTKQEIVIFLPSKNYKAINSEFSRKILTQWYKNQTQKLIEEKCHYWTKKMNIAYPKIIEYKKFKARWAACYKGDKLKFDWRVIMIFDNLIDYLVIHELAHIVHFNHSPLFWKLVEGYMPDYKNREELLKKFRFMLSF